MSAIKRGDDGFPWGAWLGITLLALLMYGCVYVNSTPEARKAFEQKQNCIKNASVEYNTCIFADRLNCKEKYNIRANECEGW